MSLLLYRWTEVVSWVHVDGEIGSVQMYIFGCW